MRRIAALLTVLVLLLTMLAACSKPLSNLSAAELLDLGEKYLLEMDYEQALVQFLKVIEVEPMNPRGYTGAAEAYVGLGELDKAIEVLNQGLEKLSDDTTITEMLTELAVPEQTPQASAEEPEKSAETSSVEIPGAPLTFVFSSGAGAWSTEVTVQSDGSFAGAYHDSDMGDIGEGYPNGIRYESFFSGRFVDVVKISELEYSLRIGSLESEGTPGTERITDGVKVITSSPYGFDKADEFLLYLPGRSTNDLPQEFIDWVHMPMAWSEIPAKLPFYGLYNVGGQEGFFSYATVNEPTVSANPADAFTELSKAERKALHTFFSNFSEVGMSSFDSANYSDAELIEFAIWHTYRNNSNLISSPNNDGYSRISADTIANAALRYFDIQIDHQSVGYVDNPNYWNYGQYNYEYRDGYYYFSPADGAPLIWSQVTSLSHNEDGTFIANIDVYEGQECPDNIYDDIEDWHLTNGMKITRKGEGQGDVWEGPCYSYSAVAVIAPYTYGGKSTYKVLSIKVQ